MNIRLSATAICLCFLTLMNCCSDQERKGHVRFEYQEPERIRTDLPNFLYLVVEKDGKYFYHFGGRQTRTPIEFKAIDALVLKHKQTKDAGFVVKPCGRPIHDNWETLMTRLETLGVKEFDIDDTCL